MKTIKSYEDFIKEEIDFRKAIIGGAIAASSLVGCDPVQQPSNQHNTETSVTSVAKTHMDIPNSFKMEEELLSIGTDMEITSGGGNFGRVEERTLNIGKTFEYKDNTGKILATAKQEVFSLYTVINIVDENNNPIGSIEQEILESLFSFYSTYSIKDATGNIIAKSKKLDFFTTDVDIVGGNSTVTLGKEAFTIGDEWDVNVSGDIDKRLIIFIPSFISSSQAEKKSDD